MRYWFIGRSRQRLIAGVVSVIAVGIIGFSLGGLVPRSQKDAPNNTNVDAFVADTGTVAATDEFDPLEPTPMATQAPITATNVPALVVVYISGAVVQPGTYQLSADARVSDVVELAGGLTNDADHDKINLSEHIHDAQHIHIVRIGQEVATTDAEQPAVVSDGRINLNTASASQLESLEGIGEVLAQRIVEWRATNGPFAATEDIQQIKGVSSSLYEKIKDNITVK